MPINVIGKKKYPSIPDEPERKAYSLRVPYINETKVIAADKKCFKGEKVDDKST